MTQAPRLSIIVPCRDDAAALEKLLQQLAAIDDVELIVVGHDSNQDTICAVCKKYAAEYIALREPRGLRLRAGADRARATYLWFLHADAVPGERAVDAVISCLDGDALGGYFRFRFTGKRTMLKRLLEIGIAARCRLGGIPYGDQALFVAASVYREVGQHSPVALFEEVSLVRRLRSRGRFCALGESIGVDARRWEQDGYVSRTIKNRLLALGYMLGADPGWLARRYRTPRQRQ